MTRLLGCLFVFLLFNSLLARATSDLLPLMPYPQWVSHVQEKLTLQPAFYLKIDGMSEQRALFWHERLTTQFKSFGWKATNSAEQATRIHVQVNQDINQKFSLPQLGQDERYQLTILASGISIKASSDMGALKGIATLGQLIFPALAQGEISGVSIDDSPRFPWRGLLIDSVRHFISIDAIKRQLDGMAAAKLNVFHWHLTDDQGWRIELESYPKLHLEASDGQFYTKAQINEVVHYAALLGIRVVPEFDVPGHASAIAVAYPELITKQKKYQMEDGWGVFEPLLDPSNPKVYPFIDAVVEELTTLFPDEYLHIGGDEVNPEQWVHSKAVQHYMKKNKLVDTDALQAFFNSKIEKILAKHHRKMMGWDEIFHPSLPRSIMVQSWRGLESLSQIAQSDYSGLLSTGFYIDQAQSTAYHYRNELFSTASDQLVPLTEQDEINAYKFSMPRLKGSAVNGILVLVKRNNDSVHAYVKLNNNHFKKATLDRQLTFSPDEVNFTLDSWMGPTRGEFQLGEQTYSGRVLIGNTPYSVHIEAIVAFDPQQISLLPSLSAEAKANIKGGEATLWTEMVTEQNIDVRTWPRVFAIAERFWSAKSKNNRIDMFKRLALMEVFGQAIGLKHQAQYLAGITSLAFVNSDITPLFILAEQLEPAHYYTRHHIKYQQGKYHQNAPLNRFEDFLPVESATLIALEQQLQAFKRGEVAAMQRIIDTQQRWHANIDAAIALIKKSPKLSDVLAIASDARTVNTIGLTISHHCISGVNIQKAEAKRMRKKLRSIHSVVREVVVASNLFTEKLLDACR